jgi:hypothetical protein
MTEETVTICYTNYKQETAIRNIIPERLWFGVTPHHSEPQWFIDAFDIGKSAKRSFAVVDIKLWAQAQGERR